MPSRHRPGLEQFAAIETVRPSFGVDLLKNEND